MTDRLYALTPDALAMIDAISRTGSFAAAARERGKVPSALTYSVRQLEDALDVLLFNRSSRQAQFTEAGRELLQEGRRLLHEMDAVAGRVQRIAGGWEAELDICVDEVVSQRTVFNLVEAFGGVCRGGGSAALQAGSAASGLRLRTEVLTGAWEALSSRQVDLAIGVADHLPNPGSIQVRPWENLH